MVSKRGAQNSRTRKQEEGRRPWSWTSKQVDKLNKAIQVLDELSDYKPLTLRQIFYQFVGNNWIENTQSQYGMLSKLLKNARIDGYIPWEDIEDRVRAYHDLTGWYDSQHFTQAHLKNFLSNYERDRMQTQEVYLEVWIEKDALSSIFTRVASKYTVPVVVCRGYSSASFLNDFKTRLSQHANKRPVMLYFGDFDPSGCNMLPTMQTTLEDEMGVMGVEYKRISLSEQDITDYQLPHDPRAIKAKDTRAKKHVQAYGSLAVELDALPPDILTQKIRNAIENEIDLNLFHLEQGEEQAEIDKLNTVKVQVTELVEGLLDE